MNFFQRLSILRYDVIGLLRIVFYDYKLIFAYLKRTDRMPILPSRMLIDPCNVCNLNCPLCVTGCNEEGGIPASMSAIDFEHIVGLNPRCKVVDLYNWGEPFLNREIFAMIDYCNRKGIKTNIHTNFNVSQAVIERIIKSPPTRLVISCDGVTQNGYSAYRIGGNVELVLNNIKFLANEVRRKKLNISLNWKFLYHKRNLSELSVAKKMAQELGIKFIQSKLMCFSKNESDYWHENESRDKSLFNISCPHLWLRFHVNSSCYPVLCCSSYHKVDVIRKSLLDIHSPQELLDIWNSPEFIRGRNCFRKGREFTTINDPLLCEICSIYDRKGGVDPKKHTVLQEGLTKARKAFLGQK